MTMRFDRESKKVGTYVWNKRYFFIVALLVAGISILTRQRLWPNGLGLQKSFSVVSTVEKDERGNITKQTETTSIIPGKTLWDWMSLLGVPLSLLVLGASLQEAQQKQAAKEAKIQRQQAESNKKEG